MEWISVETRFPEMYASALIAVWLLGQWHYDTTWLNSELEWVSPLAADGEVKFWVLITAPPK